MSQFVRITKTKLMAAIVSVMAFAPNVGAEVIDSASNGFSIRHVIEVELTRAEVYTLAVNNVADWWNDDHTFSGSADNMYIEPRALGCFCEVIGEGATVVHLTVTFVSPGQMIRLSGGLGPLGLMGANGNMTWEFADSDTGTVVTLTYAVGGYLDGGLDAVAVAVDGVLVEQMSRLKAYAEQQKQD
jgi:hypothetical protein